jgi:superfamily I DNA/RNA helicase
LLKLLAGGSHLRAPAFTAVGDDDQAIYGWRGATLDNLRLLQTDFPTSRWSSSSRTTARRCASWKRPTR